MQEHARVPCGFAAVSIIIWVIQYDCTLYNCTFIYIKQLQVNDIRTGKNEDRMDSFVLSETLKYLYLIFAEPSEIDLDLDTFIFTTEAHLVDTFSSTLINTNC